MGIHGDIKSVEFGGILRQSQNTVTLANNTALTINFTCPANKKWLLLGVTIHNPDDVNRDVTLRKFKEAGKTNLIAPLQSKTIAATQEYVWPNQANVGDRSRQISTSPAELLIAGNTLEVVWAAGGASAGGTDTDGLVFEYLEWSG